MKSKIANKIEKETTKELTDKVRTDTNLFLSGVKGCALYEEMGKFAVKAFPYAGSIEHLKKLKHEADEAIAEPQDLVEYADCLLALFGAAYKAGFTYEDLLKASKGKLVIVKKRNWKRLNDGTYQHCP